MANNNPHNPSEKPIEMHARAFRLYAEGNSLKDISKSLGVCIPTLLGWKRAENWDLLLAQIYKQVLDNTGVDIVESASNTLKLIQGWKLKLLKRLESIPPHKIPILMLKDLPELSRTEQQLMGQVAAVPGEELKTGKNIPDHLKKLLNMPARCLPAAYVKCQSMGLDTNETTIGEVLAAAQLEQVIQGSMRISDVNIPDSNGSLEDALRGLDDKE